MRIAKFALIVMLSIGTLFGALGVVRSLGQRDDDEVIIGQLTTMKQRKDFFRTLTPERKSALWRKHYRTELAKHPELTAEQKAVVDLAVVMVSPDLFRDNLPEPCGPGSVFRTAAENAFRDAIELRREIFGQPAEPLPKLAHANKSQDEYSPDCECNFDSWCNSCGCSLQCGKISGCKLQNSGCGCFWSSSCNALCASCW